VDNVVVVVVAALLGVAIGSFLNVVVWRVPRGENLSRPASHCPNCDHVIRHRDNIPVLSWLILRGKCRDCSAPISVRYPAVETATAILFIAVATWAVTTGALGQVGTVSSTLAMLLALAAYLYLAAISIALALIDIETQRLPNLIVLPAYIVGVVLLAGSALLGGTLPSLLTGLIGSAALLVFYWLLALGGGMGFGDVKLAGVLGLYLGFLGLGSLAVGAFAAFAFGGVFALVMLIARRGGRKTKIPFGPWMLVGAWVGIFFGETLFLGYLRFFGLG
jgi:leader peptidase (prepilin peptidase) / N-methyltransferase